MIQQTRDARKRRTDASPRQPCKYGLSIPNKESVSPFGFKGLDDLADVPVPAIERFLAFEQKIMSLIDGGYSRNRSCLMVEDLVRNMRWHTQPGHAGNDCPAKIV